LQDTQAYYGAEAAMEKMMADLGALYASEAAPFAADINNLANYPPSLPGINYHVYSLTFASSGNVPTAVPTTIPTGAFAGLIAQIVPVTLTVDAQNCNGNILTCTGADVSMVRNVEVSLIPVFQFGVFSDGDLDFYPGSVFSMTGRVHTNGNLFVST